MSNLNRPSTIIGRRPIDAEKLKFILTGIWHLDLGDVKFSWYMILKYERVPPIAEILWNLEIGSRELAREFLTKPYSLKIEGSEAGEFKYLVLV